jgi:hypothetical protein
MEDWERERQYYEEQLSLKDQDIAHLSADIGALQQQQERSASKSAGMAFAAKNYNCAHAP